jgi:SAM-dependent methyltransferase
MPKNKTVPSQDYGLELGLALARYLLDTENLHYGYWTPELEVKLRNLPAAQEAYTDFLLGFIPKKPCSILEVGCGAGVTAARLLEMGHEVECISPPSELVNRAKERLGDRVKIHEAGFEEIETDRKFDVVMFSESFQYVRCREGLTLAKSLLKPGGEILICDFFKRKGKHRSIIGGGHKLNHLTESIEKLNLAVCEDIDITEETAPNLDLVNEFFQELGEPAYEATLKVARRTHPILTKMVRWLFRKRFERMESKYFTGQRTGKEFARTKTYRLFKLRPAEEVVKPEARTKAEATA